MIDGDGPGRDGTGGEGCRRTLRPGLVVILTLALTAGCSDGDGTPGSAGPGRAGVGTLSPAAQLAAHAAKAQDRHYLAQYRFSPAGGGPVGTARVVRTPAGVRLDLNHPATTATLAHTAVTVRAGSTRYLCVLTVAARGCVSGPAAEVTDSVVTRLQHAFDDWLVMLASRTAALSVAPAGTPTGLSGRCWSVEPVAASLDPPVDPGLYCFDGAGLLTAVRLGAGTLALVSAGPPPATVELPAAVVPALPPTAAPSPVPAGTPSPTVT